MRVLFLLAHGEIFRHYDRVVRELCARGHEVTILCGETLKETVSDRALALCQEETTCRVAGTIAPRADRIGWWLWRARELVSYANYLRPGHPSPALAERWRTYLPWPAQRLLSMPFARALFRNRFIPRMLATMARLAPPDPVIVQRLRLLRPDVVVASPFIYTRSPEVDYVHAAKALGIPVAVAVASWDNLTTKGTFHVQPDVTFVWNDAQREEAITLHDLSPDQVVATGAPTFDFWFDMRPDLDRVAFCESVGLDPEKPLVTYLCSSKFISGDETAFVDDFVKALRSFPATEQVGVLVRPYPRNAEIWREFTAPSVAVWPRSGETPDIAPAMQQYYDTLYQSAAVVGVNTSAFLDAAVLDRRCLTIVTEHYRRTQAEIGHFKHLVRGDFLETAASASEAAAIIGRFLQGYDGREAKRRAFVKEFLRPLGESVPASTFMAQAIETLSERRAVTTENLVRRPDERAQKTSGSPSSSLVSPR